MCHCRVRVREITVDFNRLKCKLLRKAITVQEVGGSLKTLLMHISIGICFSMVPEGLSVP